MSQYLINESTLTAIADAVREKNGTNELILVSELPTAIAGIEAGGGLNTDYLKFTGNISYLFNNGNWLWIIKDYGNLMSFNNITNVSYAFGNITKEIDLSGLTIPFDNGNIQAMFSGSTHITKLPSVSGKIQRYTNNIFNNCNRLTTDEINKFFRNLTINTNDNNTSLGVFLTGCYSLRDVTEILEWISIAANSYTGTSNTIIGYSQYFYQCISLDSITNLHIYKGDIAKTSNAFNLAFGECYRLSDVMFETDNGTPYTVKWKSQTIDLSGYVGYANPSFFRDITNYNSGITADKKVTDDATYQALKDDPDWFTANVAYSRYNHDSAVRTINSLPDTSAYLATAGGTNTIKFKGEAGSATDGGAINTLTEEEIAVATAKGWTVTLV